MIKATGVNRPVDKIGRIVIPKELLTTMNIKDKDPLEFFVDGNQIILKRYEPICMFCGNDEMLITLKGKRICMNCLAEMAREVG